MSEDKLRALLAEVRKERLVHYLADCAKGVCVCRLSNICARIDAALAEPLPQTVTLEDVKEAYSLGWCNGGAAMREAAAAEARDRVNNLDHGEIEDAILALPTPEEK